MHGHRFERIEENSPLRMSPLVSILMIVAAVVGLGAFAYGAFMGPAEDRARAWTGMLVAGTFFWFLSMGGGSFLAINYIVGAKWFVAVKRLPESLAQFSYRGGFLFALLPLLGIGSLYAWAHPGSDYPYEGTLKRVWLSPGVHYAKVIVYVAILTVTTFVLVSKSRAASRSADDPAYRGRYRFSIAYIIVFGLAFSFFSWDVLMSLEAKWFSTMFGVYCFIGAFNSAMALMMMMMFYLRAQSKYVQDRHLHDMGTYVMAFATFMIYIGFSQFMLVWYANLYEETFYFLNRYRGGWYVLTILLPILKWIVPFLILMPPSFRTNLSAQTVACVSILVGQAMDIYWIVQPALSPEAILPSVINVLTFVGVGGVFGYTVINDLASHSKLPAEDPDLMSSVNGDYLHA
ncbi:hypothetical protein IT570_02785 [Candidatus Sumerlaeota bacterium]|nr:hypothetical protein [Candidatus Sumerlaeota bacterium]